jgi:hypothetical protein
MARLGNAGPAGGFVDPAGRAASDVDRAYRDNEVNSAHPLIRKLEAIRKAGAVVHEIILAPLAHEDLGRLIGDALHCEPERVTALAELIHEKTAGNPFFANQLISVLVEEGLLTFDYGEGRWSWDLNRIRAKGYTDNVVDLYGRQVEPSACRNAARITASCVHGQQRGVRSAGDGFPAVDRGNAWPAVGSDSSGPHLPLGTLLRVALLIISGAASRALAPSWHGSDR